MKKVIVILMLLVSIMHHQAIAQQVYDIHLDTIKSVLNEAPRIYEDIMKKFVAQDTTLEWVDYLTLYYGKAFMPGYSPYGASLSSEISALIKEEKHQEALKEVNLKLISQPTNLKLLQLKGYLLNMTNDTVNSKIAYNQYFSLLSIPFFSGNGLSADSAFVVTSVSDEYLIVRELELTSTSQSLISINKRSYDILHCIDKEGNQKKLYFDNELPFKLGLAGMFSNLGNEKNEKKKKNKK